MSLLMDYGHDWPPRAPRSRSLLRWLNEGKRRRRPGFDRFFWINTAAIIGVAVLCTVLLRLTTPPSPPFVVGNQSPPTHAPGTAERGHPSPGPPGRNNGP